MDATMADLTKVDPVDLYMSSDHLDMHHAELHTAHSAANGAIEEAQPGWVGASAAVLQSKLVEWQGATAQLCGEIAAHRDAFRAAAAGYQSTDTDSAEKLDDEV